MPIALTEFSVEEGAVVIAAETLDGMKDTFKSWQMGGLSMLAFALGTTPLMLGFGLVGGRLNQRWRQPMRYVSAALVAVMELSMLSSGLALTGVNLALPGRGPANVAVVADEGQTVWSELDWGGYPVITVQAGLPVTWTLHADAEKLNGCNNALVIPEYGVSQALQPGGQRDHLHARAGRRDRLFLLDGHDPLVDPGGRVHGRSAAVTHVRFVRNEAIGPLQTREK